jgi:hypothetical protein
MSAVAPDSQPPGPPTWRPVGEAPPGLPCGQVHHVTAGRLDETARRLSHEELAIAELFVAEGHDVRSVPESRRGGRRADLSVCGAAVEVKSFLALGERTRQPGARSVHNKLADAAGQARHVVLVSRGSGLSQAAVRQGLAQWALRAGPDPVLDSVRAVGDGYDLTWACVPGQALDLGRRRAATQDPARPWGREMGH